MIEKSKPARRIRPSRELEVGVDATGKEDLVGTSSTVQGVLDVHQNARENREGMGGSGKGKGRVVVGSKGMKDESEVGGGEPIARLCSSSSLEWKYVVV